MYGVIGKMRAVAGRRDDLAAILLEGVSQMPGCLAYVGATDASDAEVLWVTEAWDRKDCHAAALSLPFVKDSIARAKPLIAAFEQYIETTPVGGHGLGGA